MASSAEKEESTEWRVPTLVSTEGRGNGIASRCPSRVITPFYAGIMRELYAEEQKDGFAKELKGGDAMDS